MKALKKDQIMHSLWHEFLLSCEPQAESRQVKVVVLKTQLNINQEEPIRELKQTKYYLIQQPERGRRHIFSHLI